ncbi:MAG TPA: leucyl aminopeptidase [Bacteroidia bacterium]|nr:leucyl aminopeptidase [Bacteroidia bacterium]
MNTTISRVKTVSDNEHLVIFTKDIKKFNTSFFTPAETGYVKTELSNDTRQVLVNQYKRVIVLQVIDKSPDKNKVLEACRKAGDKIADLLNKRKAKSVTLADDNLTDELLAFAEGMYLGNYQFLKYKKEKEKDIHSLSEIKILNKKISDKDFASLNIVCEAACIARDLVNEPQSFLTATQLAREFQSLGKQAGFSTEVFNKSKIQSMKMGGLLAVNQGSIEPPTFTIMEYKPNRPVNKKPYILVGKGVVYDTGGLSLKPTLNSMDYMKCDMAGGAVVGTTLYAIAKAKLPIHVIGLVPATDNRPDGGAYTPGDVITMYSGLTVEVLNTDAEGRMILADALHYAKQYNPELVCEFSTLTGAASVAVGHYGIVCMGNADNRTKKELNDSANHVFERLVEFPFWEEYDELIKSDIADMKNVGGSAAGAITAGRFLNKFIDYPFMHFDIAGPAFLKTNDSYRGKNGTGIGVRFMFDFLKKKAGK